MQGFWGFLVVFLRGLFYFFAMFFRRKGPGALQRSSGRCCKTAQNEQRPPACNALPVDLASCCQRFANRHLRANAFVFYGVDKLIGTF